MSIRVMKQINCDGVGCNRSELDDGIGVEAVWSALKADGWTRLYGEHHCPDCSKRLGRVAAVATAASTEVRQGEKGV